MKIYFDGSYREKKLENVWWGFVAVDGTGSLIHLDAGREQIRGAHHKSNSHVAELRAMCHAISWAHRAMPERTIEFLGDNISTIELISGRSKSHPRYRRLIELLRSYVRPTWSFRWIPRTENTLADRLAHFGNPDSITDFAIRQHLRYDSSHAKVIEKETAGFPEDT